MKVYFDENSKPYILSHELAELIGKKKDKVLRDIRNLINKYTISKEWFAEDFYEFERKVGNNIGKSKHPTYRCTLEGVKLYIDNTRKSPKLESLIDWYNKQINGNLETIVLISRFEDSFIIELEQTLEPLGYKLMKQKSVFNGKYKIDAYIEELNLAIEYDEEQHNIVPNQQMDKQRQSEIEQELNCTFIRCDYKNTNSYNIGLVIKEIVQPSCHFSS